MKTRIRIRVAYFLKLLLLCGWAALVCNPALGIAEVPGAQERPTNPTPQVLVSLQRDILRENDKLPIALLVFNPTDHALTSLNLHVALPDKVGWKTEDCPFERGDGKNIDIQLGSLASYKVISCTLYLTSSTEVKVGDYNLPFFFRYHWHVGNKELDGFTGVEKSLKVRLFGNESIGGVPLSLIGLILPGLLFLAITKAMKVPIVTISTNESGQMMIYSALASIFIAFFIAFLGQWAPLLTRILDVSAGISTLKIMSLAVSGIVLGILSGIGYKSYRWLKKWWLELEASRLMSRIRNAENNENYFEYLEEFSRHGKEKYGELCVIKDKEGDEFAGSMCMEVGEYTCLAGWYQLDVSSLNDETATRLKESANESKWFDVIKKAKENKLTLTHSEFIKVTRNGQARSQSSSYAGSSCWRTRDIERIVPVSTSEYGVPESVLTLIRGVN